MKKTYKQQIKRVLAEENTGLSNEQVLEREQKGFINKSSKDNEKSTAKIIFSNCFTFFNTILFSIALLFLVFIIFLQASGNGEVVNIHFGFSKFAFLFPAVINVIIGTVQEINSRNTIRKLKIVTAAKIKVVRNATVQEIETNKLVIDDIAIVAAGEQAVADYTVISGEVSVDESLLTGESDYVKKKAGDTILSGSTIMIGSAKVRVEAVGDQTYATKLSQKVKNAASHKSELMTNIHKILKILTIMLAIVSVTIIITLMVKIHLKGNVPEIWDDMTMSITNPVSWARIMVTVGSFGVGIIPSGLMLTSSLAMIMSIAGLAKKQTLIQELYSLENLSRVDVICLDKTGTLTDGTMNLKDVKAFTHLEIVVEHIKNLMATQKSRNQTAEAIYKKFGEAENVKIKEIIQFSSQTKYSGLIYENGDKLLMGAPEYLLDKTDEHLKIVEEEAKQGRRVIALKLNNELLSFFILEDHIRDSAKDTLKFFYENGVDVKIISGDNPITVSKIAEECGVKNSNKYISLEGVKLEDIPNIADKYTIFARVSPEQKEALVEALQKQNHKVAMTGDGVNDILALRKANTSISFATATEAAKSCADVILLDNDFSHLKDVVSEGRRVINNVQNMSVLFIMKAVAIIIFAFAGIAFTKGQMWYSIENAYMLECSVIGTGAFLLSLDKKNNKPLTGSFIKNVNYKGMAAGVLAAISIIIPIMLYTVPTFFGKTPIISARNVRTMITILLTCAGFVVLLSLCVPFNKYKARAFIFTLLVATALAFMFPTAYVGGRPISTEMFTYDISAGQNIFNSPFFTQYLRPWNAPVVQMLNAQPSNFLIIALFFLVTFPLFYQILRLVDRYVKANYDKDDMKKTLKQDIYNYRHHIKKQDEQ